MIRRLFLSAALGTAGVAGLALTPASADAHPYDPVPVYRPAYYPLPHHRHHHHHSLFGVRVYVPAPPPIVVARPIVPAPVVVVPAPACPPEPVIVPYRR
jgi:hypothetical protein